MGTILMEKKSSWNREARGLECVFCIHHHVDFEITKVLNKRGTGESDSEPGKKTLKT